MGIFAPASLVPGDLSSDDAGCHGTLASRELLRLPGQITLGAAIFFCQSKGLNLNWIYQKVA